MINSKDEQATSTFNIILLAKNDLDNYMKKEDYILIHKKFANPYVTASKGMVDDEIDPRETRIKIVQALGGLKNKKGTRPYKKHGNMPF